MIGTGNRRLGTFQAQLAHRVSLKLSGIDVPDELCVLHRCDNPPCVNPSHLYVGTKKENSKDMMDRGRENRAFGEKNSSRKHPEKLARGEKHPAAKLDQGKAGEIRSLYLIGNITQADLGRKYGVSQATISRVVLNRLWS